MSALASPRYAGERLQRPCRSVSARRLRTPPPENHLEVSQRMFRSLVLLVVIGSLAADSFGQTRITREQLGRLEVTQRARIFENSILAAAARAGIDPRLLWTIAYLETRFRPWMTSPKGARGMMQFMPGTAARFALRNPFDPDASISAAARYVQLLSRLFDGRIESILAAYNAGEGTVSAYLHGRVMRAEGKVINASSVRTTNGVPPYRETRNYVANGIRVFNWLGGRQNTPSLPLREVHLERSIYSDNLGEQEKKLALFKTVLYDPRSGERVSLTTDSNNRPIREESGPVVITPEVRSRSSASARANIFFATANGRSPIAKPDQK